MLVGNCSGINESQYFNDNQQRQEQLFGSFTIAVSCLGLVLNVLSLVVFIRVFRRANNRNNFHLFFVFLSLCEILFCMFSVATYTIMSISKATPIAWSRTNPTNGETTTIHFQYSVYIGTTDALASTVLHNLLSFSGYMSIVSQISRNYWVAITALLRCYVATRRAAVQIGQIYSLSRICGIFAAKVAVVLMLGFGRSMLRSGFKLPSLQARVCELGEWKLHEGALILQVERRSASSVNFGWTLLSQVLPLIVIIVSSVILVKSLNTNSMVNSSERNKKITRMVFIFALTFAVLEGPRAVAYIAMMYMDASPQVRGRTMQVTYIMSVADSIVNVFIYFFNDQHFKKELCRNKRQFNAKQESVNNKTDAQATDSKLLFDEDKHQHQHQHQHQHLRLEETDL